MGKNILKINGDLNVRDNLNVSDNFTIDANTTADNSYKITANMNEDGFEIKSSNGNTDKIFKIFNGSLGASIPYLDISKGNYTPNLKGAFFFDVGDESSFAGKKVGSNAKGIFINNGSTRAIIYCDENGGFHSAFQGSNGTWKDPDVAIKINGTYVVDLNYTPEIDFIT